MSDHIGKRLAVQTICQDLIFLILKRLPVKSLLRFRCVCKSWKELVASKCFVLDHLAVQTPRLIAQNRSRNYLLFDSRTLPSCDTLTRPNQFQIGLHSFAVVAGVHGVLCLHNGVDILFLWNPSTRQSLRIPLRCHEKIRSKYCGFWIDPSTNDFKIVVLKLGRFGINALLFSSRKPALAWTEVDASGVVRGCCASFESFQVLIGGVAYWLACADFCHRIKLVLCFDFEQDAFRTIELPEPVLASESRRRVRVCKWQDSPSVVHWQESSYFN